jgi:putative endonuclease
MINKSYFVYVMASDSGTVYIGFTDNLKRRVWEHKNKVVKGFTEKYDCHKLIYFENYSDPETGILREKQLKSWNRTKKEVLIKQKNPRWLDLYDSIL